MARVFSKFVTAALVTVGTASAGSTTSHGKTKAPSLAPVSAITNVISILKDMRDKVTKDKIEGTKLADDQENECIKATTEGKAEIKRQSEIKEESAARVDAADASASSYQVEFSELSAAIASKNQEKAMKKSVYKEESTNIASELAEMIEVRDMLVQAYQVLKRHLSFVQGAITGKKGNNNGFLQKKGSNSVNDDTMKIKRVLTGLSAIVNAAWVDNQSAKVINKFIHEPETAAVMDNGEEDFASELPHGSAPETHEGADVHPIPGDELPPTDAPVMPPTDGEVPPVEGGMEGDSHPPMEPTMEPPMPAAAYLQVKAPAQAITSSYQSSSGTQKILSTISDLQVKAESQISDLKKRELNTKHTYELYTQDALSIIENKTEQAENAKNSAAQSKSSAQDAGNKNQQATALLEDEITKLRNKEQSCKKAAEDWASLKNEMEEEFSILGQGIEILSGKFDADSGTSDTDVSLVQIRKHRIGNNINIMNNNENPASSAASLLRQLGEKYDNFTFVQAASKLDAGDPFAKVRDLINSMIVKLEQEQTNEADFEAECKTNKSKGKAEKTKKETKLAQLESRLKGHKAKHVSLKNQISETTSRIEQIEQEQADSTVVFNQTQKEDKAIVDEAGSSIEALDKAILVLQDFYGDKIVVTAPVSLAQTTVSTGMSKSEKGETVIKVLAQAQADFLQIKSKTEEKLRHDKSKYNSDSQNNAVSLARHKTELEAKQTQKSSLGVVIEEVNTDLNNAEIELNAAVQYLNGVLEKCANKPMSFEERQARRGEEISGLKQALDILSAEGAE